MPSILNGQTAIVTGGGRAIADGLTAARAAVALVAGSEHELTAAATQIANAGGRALARVADVRDQHAVERVVEHVERQLGPVDLLVNNAGTGAAIGPTWEADPSEWWSLDSLSADEQRQLNDACRPGMQLLGGSC